MPDKRKFHVFLNRLKDETPSDIGLIESIQKKFEEDIESITDKEKKALKQFPMQFVKRIAQDDMGWTSQLHVWAEQGIPQILDIDPMLLAFKNGYGDSVLMSLVASATGTYTETNDYDLLQKILDKDFTYEDVNKDEEGNEEVIERNALEEVDVNDQTPLDYLIDFAYATGDYEGMKPEPIIQEMLQEFAADYEESENELKEVDEPVVKEEEPEPEPEPEVTYNNDEEYSDYEQDTQTEDMGPTDVFN
jgi:hypothetical protein